MRLLTGLLKWLIKAFVFFTLFAFSLNNGHDVTLNFFFGHYWKGPLVLVVLATFVVGIAVGVLGMAPRWWRMRRAARRRADVAAPSAAVVQAGGAEGGAPPAGGVTAENLRRTELGLPLIDDGLSHRHHGT